MTDSKVSQLPAATEPLADTDALYVVQGGVSKQVSVGGAFPSSGLGAIANNTLLGNSSGGSASPSAQTALKLLTNLGGYWPDVSPFSTMHRLKDRLLIGNITDGLTGNFSGSQGSFVPTSTEGANWAPRDSQFISMASTGLIALAGFSRSGDQNAVPTECIGTAGYVINNKASGLAWALYSDVQHESGATASYGLEVALKNKGANVDPHPYSFGQGTWGLWVVAGGDPSYGGASTNPNAAGLAIRRNSNTFNTGILFGATAITGTDGSAGSAVSGTAIRMARRHKIEWMEPTNFLSGAYIQSLVTTSVSSVGLDFSDGVATFSGVAGIEVQSPRLAVTGNVSTPFAGLTGVGFRTAPSTTYTDTSSSGVVATQSGVHVFSTPAIAATNVTTYSTGYATVMIKGAPNAGANVTLAAARALIVESGVSVFQGGVSASGAAISLNASSNFAVNIGTGTTTGGVNIAGASNSLGFYAATAVTKQTVTGSRGANAALADLLTKLATLGLVTDSTTA